MSIFIHTRLGVYGALQKVHIDGEPSRDFYLKKFELFQERQDIIGISARIAPSSKLELICDSIHYKFIRDWMKEASKKRIFLQNGVLYGCYPRHFQMYDDYIEIEFSCDIYDARPMTIKQLRKLKLEKLGLC